MGCFMEYMVAVSPGTTWVYNGGPTIAIAVVLFINPVVVIALMWLRCRTQSRGLGVKVPCCLWSPWLLRVPHLLVLLHRRSQILTQSKIRCRQVCQCMFKIMINKTFFYFIFIHVMTILYRLYFWINISNRLI